MSMSERASNKDIMKNTHTRETIRRIAYEHGMTLEEAKIFFMRHKDE